MEPMNPEVIIEIITTIIVYKFTHLTRLEVETMLGLNLQETRFYQDVKAEGEQIGEQIGEQRGRKEEALALVVRLLTRRFQQGFTDTLRTQVSELPLPQLEDLAEALLDFSMLNDLEQWLTSHPNPVEDS